MASHPTQVKNSSNPDAVSRKQVRNQTEQQLRPAARRRFWDRVVRIVVSIGGLGTISAILLIFFYLVYEVLPLFRGADMTEGEFFPELTEGSARLLETDTAAEVALRIDEEGRAEFYDLSSGELLAAESLTSTNGAQLTTIAEDSAGSGLFAAGFADGEALIASWNAAPEPEPGADADADADAVSPRLEFPSTGSPINCRRMSRFAPWPCEPGKAALESRSPAPTAGLSCSRNMRTPRRRVLWRRR